MHPLGRTVTLAEIELLLQALTLGTGLIEKLVADWKAAGHTSAQPLTSAMVTQVATALKSAQPPDHVLDGLENAMAQADWDANHSNNGG